MSEEYNREWLPLRPQIDPKRLDQGLAILSGYYNFVSLSMALDILNGKVEPVDNAMVITMDDGYVNQFELAVPICNKYDAHPIVYVVAGKGDGLTSLWFDRLDYVLQHIKSEEIALTIGDEKIVLDLRDRLVATKSYKLFRDKCKDHFVDDYTFNEYMNNLISRLETESGHSLENIQNNDLWCRLARLGSIRSYLNRYNLEIGSHTMSHYRLDKVDRLKIIQELELSKKIIEEKVGEKCIHLCYPNGDYSEEVIQLVKDGGYLSATTSDSGSNFPGQNVYKLKRVHFPLSGSMRELLFFVTFGGLRKAFSFNNSYD
ncbi:MAG: polysaccharide deacetylase family protein [Gammaproteobacteria bacterium]|nr:polysaccharide deacetylase family protein [Gammaproteobacteria bacterium]